MKASRFLLAILAGTAVFWLVGTAHAQQPLPIRDRPTLSPWLNLYRQDPGPVGPYLSYVRPEQRLRAQLAQQRTGLAQQAASLRALRSELSQARPETSIMPTGTGAGFMNHGRYFGGGGQAGGRSGGPSWTPSAPSRGSMGAY